eukprot:1357886-Amorphochlora_amoeboformis.AAC.1
MQDCDVYQSHPELVIWGSQTGSSIHGSNATKEAMMQGCDEYQRRPQPVIWQSQTPSSIHDSNATEAPKGSNAGKIRCSFM